MYDDTNSYAAFEIGAEFAGVDRYYFDVVRPTALWWALLTKQALARRKARRAGEKFEGRIKILLVRPPSGGEEFDALEPLDASDVIDARGTLTPYFKKRGFTIDTVELEGVSWGSSGEYVRAIVTFS